MLLKKYTIYNAVQINTTYKTIDTDCSKATQKIISYRLAAYGQEIIIENPETLKKKKINFEL